MLSISGSGKQLTRRDGNGTTASNTALPHTNKKGREVPVTQASVSRQSPDNRNKSPTKSRALPSKQQTCQRQLAVKKNAASVTSMQPLAASSIITDVVKIAETKLAQAPDTTQCGEINIKFNHYNKAFAVYNGVVRWSDIDELYCLSFVYKGNYRRDLYSVASNGGAEDKNSNCSNSQEQQQRQEVEGTRGGATTVVVINGATRTLLPRDKLGTYFVGATPGTQYHLDIEEDPIAGVGAEGLTIRSGPISFKEVTGGCSSVGGSSSSSKCPLKSGNGAVQDLTRELKSMKTCDLGGETARELLERRDLEDILYSNSS